MKTIKNIFLGSAVVMTAGILTGCSNEAPFNTAGEGSLRITPALLSDVKKVSTRAVSGEDKAYLDSKLVVYIEKEGVGVIRKYKGADQIPENISLQAGNYVVEGWTGDSVSASFDKKFFRGYEEVVIQEGLNTMTLNCKIANVIVSINTDYLNDALADLSVTVNHTRGELTFSGETLANKGYFMMPNGTKENPAPQELNYKIEGTQADGSSFVKEGVIKDVERAHEYALTLKADAQEITTGGALVKLEIVDTPVIDEEAVVFPAPGFTATAAGKVLDLDAQWNISEGVPSDAIVRVLGYGGLTSVKVSFSDNFGELTSVNDANLISDEDASNKMHEAGVKIEQQTSTDAIADNSGKEKDVHEMYFTFTKSFLESLEKSTSQFIVEITATDGRGFSNSAKFRFANDEAAVERLAPVGSASAPDPVNEPMAVLAHSATLTGYIYSDEAQDYGIKYREVGTEAFTEARPSATRAAARAGKKVPYTVTISGLKSGTAYEYRAFCDGFEEDNLNTFTTEGYFEIPNASFEEWDTYQASTMLGERTVSFPGTGTRSFWDSGNEGAATANKVLTNKYSDVKHSGNYSARLASDEAMRIIAAGNIFVGQYVKTDGTDGVLSVGRPFNGSHPSKVRVYANYRPGGNISVKKENVDFLPEGFADGKDHGQIYIALTTKEVELRTKASNRKLFDKNDPEVLAYGQVTWAGEDFGADNTLEKLEIPFEYNDRAKTNRATHLVIVASASKYGDFFSGSKESVMILDDFELVYDN